MSKNVTSGAAEENNDELHKEIPKPVEDLFAELEQLQTQDYGLMQKPLIEKILTAIPVRKPSKACFFRTHPIMHRKALVLTNDAANETYILHPNLEGLLLGETCVDWRRLQLAVNVDGTPFLWSLRLPDEGRRDLWASTALDAAFRATSHWIRMQSNRSLGGYVLSVAQIKNEPVWPTLTMPEILKLAFGEVIDSMDHPVLKKLRGEI